MTPKDSSSSRPRWREFVPKSWELLSTGYNGSLFKSDLMAGVTVGIVAIPLAMAFAIAAGVSPEKGLYTAIVAGFLISLLGGSRFQIGGPTGAFVVIIYNIVQEYGYEGLVTTTLIAALLLIIAALARLGTWIKYIPYPLITGFTTGIAVIIFSSQVKDFLGLQIAELPADFIPKWGAIFAALPTFDLTTFALSSGTLLVIILIRKFLPVVPWGVASVALATLVAWGFGLQVETILSRFGPMHRELPFPSLPHLSLSWSEWHVLIPSAFTVAFLAGIESLLSAIVADGMAGTKHKSNCELMGQGIANLGSILFGGIPATGAIARTATNIKTGAKTPVAGMIHSLTLLLVLFAFAPIVSQIPLAALSAVLIMVAWNMSEIEHFRHLFKAPPGDVAVLMITFLLTVLVDLTVAVEVGMILAAFLFMKRVSDLTTVSSSWSEIAKEEAAIETFDIDAIDRKQIPPQTEVYEITGPFFFGIADSLKDVLTNLKFAPKVFILRMRKVTAIDASGMHALREFYIKCHREKTLLLLSGVHHSVQKTLDKFGVIGLVGKENILPHIDAALSKASQIVSTSPPAARNP